MKDIRVKWGKIITQSVTLVEKKVTREKNSTNKKYSVFFRGEKSRVVPQKAFQWALAHAEHGNAAYCCRVANCYDFGIGVRKDKKKALYWYKIASDKGDKVAQYNLAFSFNSGDGVRVDLKKAYKLMHLSASQGYPEALPT